LLQHDSRPDLYARVIELAKQENLRGGNVRPQTTARSVGLLFSLDTRSPFDRASSWRDLKKMRNGQKLVALRDPVNRARLIDAADATPPSFDLAQLFVVNQLDGSQGNARYDQNPATSLAAIANHRGISAAAAYIELQLESDGELVCSFPFLNQSMSAVEHMLDERLVTLGLADAGAHVGQILDASQPTFLLSYWIRERQRWSLEEGVRRLTSDTADLFGLAGRGRLTAGSFADVNVIDFEALDLPAPSYVHDFPNGAGRYVQASTGYDYTLVNGQVFMDHGEHTGALAGSMLKNAAAG
jgi:N-acyl-D-amino-acid deacylase